MLENKQKRPDAAYVSKLAQRVEVWNRKTEEANKYVFEDLDAMLNQFMVEAYKNSHFEGFAHLERMKHYITNTFPLKLQKELDYIKTLPIE
jgi:hypothetical protein